MKRALILAIGILLVSLSAGTVQAAEIYWVPGEGGDGALLELDTNAALERARPAPTTRPTEIYDSRYDDSPVVDISGDEAEVPVVRPQRQTTPSTVRQRPAESAPAKPQSRRQRTQETTRSPDTKQKATVKEPKKKLPTPEPAALGETEKPESQRQKPGEVDVQPAEPKSKLQWGR